MELDEIRERIEMRELMEERDRQSHAPSRHPCEGMSLQEVLRFVTFLMDSLQEKNAALKSITEKLDSIMVQLSDAQAVIKDNAANMHTLTGLVESLTAERDRLRLELGKKAGENAVNRKFRFAGHSQKGTAVKSQPKGRDDDRDDFDGTQNPDAGTQEASDAAMVEESNQPESKKARPERQGMKYNTMAAEYKKTHLCDRSRLPEGSVRTDHFPMEGDTEPVRCIPGTHATADLLSNLAFNKYGQMTPLYREINRFRNEM